MKRYGQQPRKFPRWIFIAIAIAILAILSFVGIWRFLSPTERHVVVAFSDFVAEVHAGRVDEIRIRDREITFRTHDANGRTVTKETVGPVPDQALVTSLKPDDPDKPLPKIYFEK